ncbi:uncharacterized protein LOC127426942 [Myxocyprinus asiaticus]|uniref:uncharacterized protein LOC127426942 n=1 Tax=Myxocyprinus asiaticus TaxID=70543 RepID=UPI002221E374|nr:uncharacterized protein LOC127426942 [Myxocyprinus asiaticus]XP_051530113.1 uncharacterized protein LOC127426942 [Myxocyprinus asiaticus]XP_051530114.1 uncharacterized protein LOC127426942 [Myxocyprinus asiaticus]XP_051530115.1 uncharacterized protein LOC127426942 [Myxocyprinus asiaticus]XP_051530116.1 uncharacterized protein LOC127426942 [Myxocyprinus asiaticus]XP_051530117.1 uncharacterized protein LOC127426942 [Myxocyprinus asiaticus]XP_051530118.1 uncharacterized protein LOC127426942 [
MEEGQRQTSEIYLPSISLGSADSETVEGHELPIISLSKSSTDMMSGPPQRMELTWYRQNLRKSASSAACTQRPVSLGGPATVVPLNLCDHEQGSMCSGNSTPETVIWHGGTARPWSVMEDTPRRTPMQDLLLGQNQAPGGVKCVPHSPSTNRDLMRKDLVNREGSCRCCRHVENPTGCSCCRMTCRMSSSALSNSFTQQANSEDHIQSNCESHHFTACHRSTYVGHMMNNSCLRNSCTGVPCPGHLISQPACAGSPCAGQRSILHSGLLGFPPLVSSVSETRLDSRRSGHCCGSELRGQNSSCLRLDRTGQTSLNRTIKDATTMTSDHELRDVGVQTISSDSLVSPLSHVFPEMNLRADLNSDTSSSTERMCHKTPMKEVEWDAEGMTWEVYGAALDPEELGLAIQKHLELQIKETAAAAAAQKEDSTETVSGLALEPRQQKKSEGIIRSLRSSACCSNPNTVGD